MDGSGGDTLWGVLRDMAVALVAPLGAIVAWLWKKVAAVEHIEQRLDVLATTVDDVLERQTRMELDQHKADVLVAKLEETLNWLRTAISEINRKLDK